MNLIVEIIRQKLPIENSPEMSFMSLANQGACPLLTLYVNRGHAPF